MELVIHLFGPPHLEGGGEKVRLSSKKVMGLLAYLAMRMGEPIARGHLAGLLWADVPEDQARSNLRQALSQLRKTFRTAGLDPILATVDEVILRGDDAIRIPARALSENLPPEELLKIASGPSFLEGLSTRAPEFDTWAVAKRQALDAQLIRALTELADICEADGRRLQALEAIAASLNLDWLNESLQRRQMELLAAVGRTDAALAQFEKFRELLRQALGVEPEAETRELARTIRNSRGTARHIAPPHVLTWISRSGQKAERFTSLTEAIEAGLDRLADDRDGQGAVTLGSPNASLLLSLPSKGLFLPNDLWGQLGQSSGFSLAVVEGHPDLRQVSVMTRNRMMVSATTTVPPRRIQDSFSIAVLPFREVSPEAAKVSLGVVLAEEVSARLARFGHLTVASPSAAITCRTLDLSLAEIHERLGVVYAVDGSVFRIGDDLRMSMSITDLTTGKVVASEKFEGAFADIFERQSDMVDRIVSTISKQTEAAALSRTQRDLTNDIGAFDWYLKGLMSYRRAGVDLAYARDAVGAFDNAYALDGDFVRSKALRACAISWYDTAYIKGGEAFRDMQLALSVRDDDPEVHRITGALAMMSGDYEAGLAHAERAVEMNPSDAYLLGQSAIYWSWYGEPDKALPIMTRAMMLDPFLPVWAVEDHGVILYSKEDYGQAITSLTRLPLRQPRGLAFKAASQVALGELVDAKETIRQLRRHSPDYTAEQLGWVTFYRDPQQHEALLDRLRQAGLS